MNEILNEIMKYVPDKALISDSGFEGANIVLYTKNKEFFLDQSSTIKQIVDAIKKRVELRPDPAICLDMEKSEIKIKEIIPADAGVSEIIFDPQRSIVMIEAEKPGIAIGKQGEILKEIKRQTLWVPIIRRAPPIKSKMIENIRAVLYQNDAYRKKFLDKVGHRIYDGWLREKKHEWIRLSILGAGRQVGRSCFLLQTPESRILLDCGVNPAASDQEAYPYLDIPEFRLDELDAVILSHPHMDHSGFLPFLYKMGYRGPMYCTPPTRDIAALLQLDFIGITFKQAKKGLYDISDVKEMVKHTIAVDYEEVTDITPDVRLTFYNAGHVLGSALTHLHIGNGLHNLLYTADFKYLRTQILEPAHTIFPRLETVIIEATYGAKTDILQSRHDAEMEVVQAIKDTVARGGKTLIPVLGVGRAQELMLILESAIRTGLLEKIPIYIHGMVWDVTAIHTAYPDYLNKNIRKAIFHKDENPFLSDVFKRVGSRKEQQEILENEGPCVILATAGFLNAGASVEYFKSLCDNPKHGIVFVSYQYEGSLGRRVQNGDKEIMFSSNGERPELLKINLHVKSVNSLSGHAGRNELIRYVHDLQPRPKKIIVNHGESSKCLDLASTLHKLNRIETVAPRNLESIRLK